MSNSNSSGCGLNWANLGKAKAAEPKTRQVYDPSGVAITLGAKDEKAAGGEGIVFTVPGKPGFLVKIYKRKTLDDASKLAQTRDRIEAMLANRRFATMPGIAWPLMPVFADANRGKMIGYVMRACSGVPFQSLFYGAKHLKKRFPTWTRVDLARVAKEVVSRVAELGEAGICVGDFNPENFLVDKDGHVSFIDTDSFQINDGSGRVIISHTHKPEVCAPEILNDRSLLNRPRTAEQTRFSAAVIAFQLLMCGVHPYSYYDPENGGGCGTPDENLRAGKCPLGFGSGSDCRMRQDVYFLWSYLTGKLKAAFIDTFRTGHSNPSARTSLRDLAYAIDGFLLAAAHDPAREDLEPQQAKPRDYRGTPRPTYPQRGFLQRTTSAEQFSWGSRRRDYGYPQSRECRSPLGCRPQPRCEQRPFRPSNFNPSCY